MWQQQLQTQGFAAIPAALAAVEIAPVLGDFNRAQSLRSRAGVRHALKIDSVAALARSSRLSEIAGEVLGHVALPYKATLFEESPRANWLVVWHQDTVMPLRERREKAGWGPWSLKEGVIHAHAPARALNQVLALRIHLDPCNAENGPLRVLPGTHTLGVLSDQQIEELAIQVPPVDCLIPYGGILAMRPLLVHASSKCKLQVRRRVLHIEYAASLFVDEGLELAVA